MHGNFFSNVKVTICAIVATGVLAFFFIRHHAISKVFRNHIERITQLTSDAVSNRIQSTLVKSLTLSLTMANDHLLKDLLNCEDALPDGMEYARTVSEYLRSHREEYGYESVFLVSARTGRYYMVKGADRVVVAERADESWYNSFLERNVEYALDIARDKAGHDELTAFVNCRVTGVNEELLGIVGVGFRIEHFQQLLRSYENEFGVSAMLVDDKNVVMFSGEGVGAAGTFSSSASVSSEIFEVPVHSESALRTFWEETGTRYVVVRPLHGLPWLLAIGHDTQVLDRQVRSQLFLIFLMGLGVATAFLFLASRIARRYDKRIADLVALRKHERQAAFRTATERLYDNIYEMNITRNCAADNRTGQYFESLGIPGDTPFDQALTVIAQKQIKEEFRAGYVSTFTPAHVLDVFDKGESQLCYEFMISLDGFRYVWIRIDAYIYFSREDHCIHMFTYRKNIEDKMQITMQAEMDELAMVYNKPAAERRIRKALTEGDGVSHAFFILDIDDFKRVNDTYGHAFGDLVITEFAATIKRCFRRGDIIGRFGGDEFVACVVSPGSDWVRRKAMELSSALAMECSENFLRCRVTASIGIAVSPEDGTTFEMLYRNADAAMYMAKRREKSGYALFNALSCEHDRL